MADRAEFRTWLQRRLQDTSATIWSVSVLNSYINIGLQDLSAAIRRIEPEFVVYVDTRDTVANEDLYQVPVNCEQVLEVWLKDTASAEYERLEFRRRKDIVENESTEPSYSMQGRYILINPTPAVATVAGIRLKYVPILSLSSDAEVPPIPISLHKGIVLAAQIAAYGDTSESADKEAVNKEYTQFVAQNVFATDVNADQDELLTFPTNLRIQALDDYPYPPEG